MNRGDVAEPPVGPDPASGAPNDVAPRSFSGSLGRLLRSRLAWQLTLFMGLQSLSYYAVLSWLPSIYQDHGLCQAASGALLATAAIVGIPMSLITPRAATARRYQRVLVVAVVALTAGGYLGLLLAPFAVPTSGPFCSWSAKVRRSRWC